MALNAYLTLKGVKTGDIKGSVTQKGREGKIAVFAFDHEITSPRDPASGLATGRRMHKPFVITKEIDKSSPLLYKVLTTNETLGTWELLCFRPAASALGSAGAETMYYKVVLTNAHIVSIHSRMLNNRIPDNSPLPQMEDITFTYSKIEWTITDGGITAADDWSYMP